MSLRIAADRRAGVVLAAAAVTLAASAPAGEGREGRDFWMPGAFLSVQTRSAAELIARAAEIVDAVKPGMGAFVQQQLVEGLKVGGVDALDALGGRRPAGLLVLNPRRQEGHVVIAVGDAGVQAILRAIGGAMGQDVDDDLLDFGDFVIGDGDTVFYFRHAAPWLLCSLAPSALDAATQAVKEGRVPRAPRREAHVAAHLDMNELRAAYGDVVAGALQIARTGVAAGGMQMQGPGAPPAFVFGIVKEYINAAEAVFQGLDELDLSVRLSREAVEIEAEALPAKDGVFAPLAATTEPATFAPALALPEGGTFVAAWRADAAAIGGVIDAFARGITRVSMGTDVLDEENEETKEKIARYRSLIEGFMAGEYASTVTTDGEAMGGVWAADVEFDTVRDIYTELTDAMAAELAPLFKGMGFGMTPTYEKNVRRLADGGRVDRMTVAYEFQGAMADQMRPMFQAMFGGDKQVTEMGDAGAGTVIGWGRDSAKVLDEAVARQKAAADFTGSAWPTASSELKRALAEVRGVITGAFEVRMGHYLAMVFGMMRRQPGMDAVMQMDEEELENLRKKDVPVVAWAGARDGKLVLYERVPIDGVKNLVEFFEKIQQRAVRGQNWREQGPDPGEPVEVW